MSNWPPATISVSRLSSDTSNIYAVNYGQVVGAIKNVAIPMPPTCAHCGTEGPPTYPARIPGVTLPTCKACGAEVVGVVKRRRRSLFGGIDTINISQPGMTSEEFSKVFMDELEGT